MKKKSLHNDQVGQLMGGPIESGEETLFEDNRNQECSGRNNPALVFAQRYQEFFNSTNDGIAVLSIDGDILDANPKLLELSGYKYVELVVKSLNDLFDEKSRAMINQRVQLLLDGKQRKYPLSLTLRNTSSKFHLVEMSLSLLKHQYGHEIVFLAVIRDITRRHEYQNKLKTHSAELQKIFDMVPGILFVIDENKRIKKVNEAGIKLLEKSKSKIMGQRVGDAFDCVCRYESVRGCGHGKSCRKCAIHENLLRCVKLGETIYRDEITVKSSGTDDRTAFYQMSISPFESGEKHWGVLSFNDITEIRMAEIETKKLHNSIARSNLELKKTLDDLAKSQAKLMESQKLESIGLLTSGLAHNLKTPLSGIKGYAQLLSLDHDFEEIQMILKEINTMEEIMSNLLLKNRQGQQKTEESIDFNDLIRLELQFLEANMFYKHQVQKKLRLADRLPRVTGVYNHFSQVFMNIVQNGLDAMYSSPEKELTVSTRYDNKTIYVDIIDTGTGIPDEIKESIFDVFFSTKPSAIHRKGDEPIGTGLGLSTANYFIHQYGGGLELVSEEGKGSKFTISIPIEDSEVFRSIPKIMVIDDSQSIVNVVVSACRKLGYEVYGTQDSENAVNMVKKLSPNLIITDLIMPKLTGPELMSMVREFNANQKVIYMSGYLGNPEFEDWLVSEQQMEAVDVVSKPIDWNLLKEKINKLLMDELENNSE